MQFPEFEHFESLVTTFMCAAHGGPGYYFVPLGDHVLNSNAEVREGSKEYGDKVFEALSIAWHFRRERVVYDVGGRRVERSTGGI